MKTLCIFLILIIWIIYYFLLSLFINKVYFFNITSYRNIAIYKVFIVQSKSPLPLNKNLSTLKYSDLEIQSYRSNLLSVVCTGKIHDNGFESNVNWWDTSDRKIHTHSFFSVCWLWVHISHTTNQRTESHTHSIDPFNPANNKQEEEEDGGNTRWRSHQR